MAEPDPMLIFRNAPLAVAAEIMREAARWTAERGELLWDLDSLSDANLAKRCQPHEVFVGELDGEPVVAALIQDRDPDIWPDDGTALIIHKLAVRRAHAGQGFANRMLGFAEQHAHAQGKKYLRLDTDSTRPKLRQFYERAGFRHVGFKIIQHLHLALFEKKL
ncbi:MAG: GNAT family N-acetyltransferase [Opitutaceae bacterium]